jgi:membrane-associated protease RseP (regulator of RpoE activity)
MGGPVAENGFEVTLSHRGSGYTSGFTFSEEHHVFPGFLVIHCGISQLQGTVSGPVGGAIGILTDASNNLNDPSTWRSAFYGVISLFTFAAWVNRGDLKAWWYFQVWK